uniref:Chitooligosaccharidolytic beta-N-acetylglucosaminidase n=2 Tax=Culex pipiens TaxID=7175 RepID=A0A8D8KEM8_CULPI
MHVLMQLPNRLFGKKTEHFLYRVTKRSDCTNGVMMNSRINIILLAVLIAVQLCIAQQPPDGVPAWGYRCTNSRCEKVPIGDDPAAREKAVSLSVCRLYCGDGGVIGTVWPRPTGNYQLGNDLVHVDPYKVEFQWGKVLGALD